MNITIATNLFKTYLLTFKPLSPFPQGSHDFAENENHYQ